MAFSIRKKKEVPAEDTAVDEQSVSQPENTEEISVEPEQVKTTNTGRKEFEPNIEGYSYGTAPDNGTDKKPSTPNDQLNERSVQHQELTQEEQQNIEDSLSHDNVTARVIQSLGGYVKVKFFLDEKPLGSYKSRNFTVKDAKKYLKELEN